MNRKLCITGGSGLLGSALLRAGYGRYDILSLDITEHPVSFTGYVRYRVCDVTDADALSAQMTAFRPDVVIHTAAFTDVDGCELDAQKAHRINVHGTMNVMEACRALDARLIHLSTDYVFDGAGGPYKESDRPNPINVYGRTKLESERIVTGNLRDFVIARAMVLYGSGPGVRQNFVTWVIDRLKMDEDIHIVDDQFGTPTLVDELAAALLCLDANDATGLYHTAGSEVVSRYEFALRIAHRFGFDAGLVKRTDSRTLHQPAKRPLKSGLLADKLKHEFGFQFSGIEEGLCKLKVQMER